VVDAAFFTATVSEEGSVMHRIVLEIRNTQQQYVRISVPHKFEIWSTLVEGTAVKPAQDEQGLVMIPLEKSSKKDASQGSCFAVEFIYISQEVSPLSDSGFLKLKFPFCDLPINQLFVTVFLPPNYKYGEFTGMRESGYWTRQPKNVVVTQSPGGLWGRKKRAPVGQVQRRGSYTESVEMNMDDDEDEQIVQTRWEKTKDTKMDMSIKAKSYGHGGNALHRGVLPVKVEMPTIGTQFYFEQLLVAQKHIELSTEYKKQKKSYGSHRKLHGCCS